MEEYDRCFNAGYDNLSEFILSKPKSHRKISIENEVLSCSKSKEAYTEGYFKAAAEKNTLLMWSRRSIFEKAQDSWDSHFSDIDNSI